jgi:hypothetical protein
MLIFDLSEAFLYSKAGSGEGGHNLWLNATCQLFKITFVPFFPAAMNEVW